VRRVLLTGFPGFLGSGLLPRLLAGAPESSALCVVQERYAALAVDRRATLLDEEPAFAGRIDVVAGDITRPGLGLDSATLTGVDRVVHLAAAYDLSLSREVGLRVNVEGTRHVLDLCEALPDFERLDYVSTCYVSGRHDGEFGEKDLDVGQSFNNRYEETKYLAEVAVVERRDRGLPATVYRPSIVVGDSRTGETQKYDGPYFVLRWLMRQPTRWSLLPITGDPGATELNVVPRDAVVAAMAELVLRGDAVGRTFHLADPSPLTVDELIRRFAEALDTKVVRVRLPQGLVVGALRHGPGLRRLTGIPADAVPYFTHPTRYATDETVSFLEGTGVRLPSITEYLDVMVRWLRNNPDVGSGPMM
jgi:thioester reductase-like protein